MNQTTRMPITRQGHEKLQTEIRHIKAVERPKILEEIEEARAHGDLSENAEYHAAREKLGHIKGRLLELEDRLSRSEVFDPHRFQGQERIVFGATVTLVDRDDDSKITYQIVGEYESDVLSGKISVTSPIARALIGKSEGDEVQVKTPKGSREFEIVEVDYK